MAIDQQTAYALSAREASESTASNDGSMAARAGGDAVCFWRERRFDDLECLKARFFRHSYALHVHDTFAIGVILRRGLPLSRCSPHRPGRQPGGGEPRRAARRRAV
jgi:hypothetical protein